MAMVASSVDLNRLSGTRRLQRRSRFKALIAAVLLGLSLVSLPAQTNSAIPTAKASNRFLFFVETSRAMRPRARGVFEAMKQALDSSLNGQIQQGDLVGIWTFNDNINQTLFPSQVWSQPTQLAFAVRLPVLADAENYTKRARLEKVIPELLRLISENENVTVVLVSSGEGVMQGAPFSAQINSAWKEWHDELEGVHMPLLTALRTRNGQAVDWLFTPAPRPIALPSLTVDSQLADAKEPDSSVLLESGQATRKTESAPLAPDQQVAFSVWALGRPSLVNSVTNPPATLAKVEDSRSTRPASPTLPTPTNAPVQQPAQPAKLENSENDSPNVAVTTPKPQERAEPAAVPAASVPTSETRQVSDSSTVTTASLNEAPAEPLKAVHLVFVTNATAPPASTLELAAKPPHFSTPAPQHSIASVKPSPNEPAIAAPQPKDQGGQQLLAHARAANQAEEKRAQDSPVAVPKRNFVRENINPLVLMLAAGFGAAYSFKRWFLSQKRISRATTSLAQESDEEPAAEEKKRPIRPRAAA